jgi:predicted ATP-dependent protease
VQTAQSTEPEALWAVAAEMDTTTLFGGFRIDPSTGAQTKHTPALAQWRDGELHRVA